MLRLNVPVGLSASSVLHAVPLGVPGRHGLQSRQFQGGRHCWGGGGSVWGGWGRWWLAGLPKKNKQRLPGFWKRGFGPLRSFGNSAQPSRHVFVFFRHGRRSSILSDVKQLLLHILQFCTLGRRIHFHLLQSRRTLLFLLLSSSPATLKYLTHHLFSQGDLLPRLWHLWSSQN